MDDAQLSKQSGFFSVRDFRRTSLCPRCGSSWIAARCWCARAKKGCSFLDPDDLHALALEELTGFCLGATDARACLVAHGDASLPVPERYAWAEVRTLFGVVGEELFWVAGRAHHLALWDRAHRYCGACGGGCC